MQAAPTDAIPRALQVAAYNDGEADHDNTCQNTWAPPTPPPSSSPLREDGKHHDAFRQQQSRNVYQREPGHGRRHVKPLASRRPLNSSPNPSRDMSKSDAKPTLPSAADWHSRFTLQCAQRARTQRQNRIDQQRNGLINEIVRPQYESREELAIWKRLAIKEKLAVESEMGEFLEDEYNLMLREIERGDTQYMDSTEALGDMFEQDMDTIDPAEEYEAHLQSQIGLRPLNQSYPAQAFDVQMSSI